MARIVFTGQLQYATVQEALAANTWLETWRAQHYDAIRPAGTGQAVMAVIPPNTDTESDPPANGQLTWTIHLEATDVATIQNLPNEVTSALGDGVVLQSVQDSWSDASGE